MKKFKVIQSTVASLMAVSMIGLSACDLLFGDDPVGDGQTYTVTLNENGGTLVSDLTSYVSGEETTLPDAEKEHYIFDGWYADEDFSGEAVEIIEKASTGNVEYWAKWTPETYSVEYYIDNAAYTESGVTTYTYGVEADLPAPTKANYSFTGWYDNSDLSGTSVMEIEQGEYGNKTYYATWTPDSYKITFNVDGGTIKNTITGYTYGVETPLPVPTKAGYAFDGWYEKSDFSDSKWEVITVGETGNKTFYAKWTQTNIIASAGYEEGAYVNIYPNGNSLSNISVSYKPLDDIQGYQAIDRELLREYTDDNGEKYVRADIVGLAEGAYSLEINVGGTKEYKDVSVTSYDRSGYAHFNTTEGVGAYNNDGTPKDNAYIIYVSEATKNSVAAPWNSSKKGIVSLMGSLSSAGRPVIIRVLGQIAAATWNEITYNFTDYDASYIKGVNGQQLPTDANSLTQAALIAGGYNTLDTSKYSELLNLSSKATYNTSKKVYDSAWNNCAISGASNVTLEGIGTDAEIFQWGFTWSKSSNIEVRNLTFDDYTEDACSFEGGSNQTDVEAFDSKHIWVHNNKFNEGRNYWDLTDEQDKHEGDGATDFKRASYITVSYNEYYKNHKTGLIGADNDSKTANVTFHHNYYNECVSRLPLARQANMHMYNNYYHSTSSTSISLRAYAYAFIEYCYFDGSNDSYMIDIQSYNSSTTNSYGVAKLYNCVMNGGRYYYQSMPNTEKPSGSALYEANDKFIKFVANREEYVANFTSFGDDFDTNPLIFYYDAVNKCSKVTALITDVNEVPTLIPQLAGVHKK